MVKPQAQIVYQLNFTNMVDQVFKIDYLSLCCESGILAKFLNPGRTLISPNYTNEKAIPLTLGHTDRRISLLSAAGKILVHIINAGELAERILPENQCGFRLGRGTVDAIFIVKQHRPLTMFRDLLPGSYSLKLVVLRSLLI